MTEEEGVDWRKVANDFQIENEVLKSQMRGWQSYDKHHPIQVKVPWKDIVSWVERHPVLVAVIIYFVSTVVTDTVSILVKDGSKK